MAIKELEKLMRGTKGLPLAYMIGRERRKLRWVREAAEDYEKRTDEVLARMKEGDIKMTGKALLWVIKDLDRLGYNTQVTEMRVVDRFNRIGDLIIKSKVPELKSLNRFIEVGREIKKLTKKNWDSVKTGLKYGREALQLKIEDRSMILKRTAKRRAMEIELWRQDILKYVLEQRSTRNKIKSAVRDYTNAKKPEDIKRIMGVIDSNLKGFAEAVLSEMKVIRKSTVNIVMLFLELRDQITDLVKEKGFPTDVPIYRKIVKEFGDARDDTSERAEIAAFRIAGNVR